MLPRMERNPSRKTLASRQPRKGYRKWEYNKCVDKLLDIPSLGTLDTQLKPYGPIQEAVQDLTVADLLTSELEWNKTRIEEVLPDFVTQIQCLHPSKTGVEDSLIWLPLPSGVYTTRHGLGTILSHHDNSHKLAQRNLIG